MKLHTQFTVPIKALRDLDYINKYRSFKKKFKERMSRLPK